MDVSTKGLIIENPNATRKFEMDKLNQAIENMSQMLEHRKKVPQERSDEMYLEMIVKFLSEYRDAKLTGKPLVYGAVGGSAWPAIFEAMDLAPYSSVALSVAVAQSQGLHQEVMDGATEAGIATYLCNSVARYAWGGVVKGFMLPPDLIVGNSIYCNTMAIASEFWAHWLGVPFYRMDRPHIYSESAVQYYAKDLRNLIGWLEEQTGHKMDWDKLEANIDWLRQLLDVRTELAELRKNVPHPMRSRHGPHLEVVDFYYAGRPEAVAFYSQIRDEAKARVAEKRGFIQNERLRLLSMFIPPTYALRILDWWEREWGAVSVMETWFNYTPRRVEIDPKKPLESLARYHFYGRECTYAGLTGDEAIEDMVWFAKEYSVDGAVWYAPQSCQECSMFVQPIKDALRKRANIPMLVVDVDYVDPTYVSEEEIREKTEPFFEMLVEEKGV